MNSFRENFLPFIWFIVLIGELSGITSAHNYIETEDTIIIEADNAENLERHKRQIPIPRQTWGEALGEGTSCLTSKGSIGACTSYRHCYPYFKLPDLGLWEAWVLGNYDTCSYFNEAGRQSFGVCCTNPIALNPEDQLNPDKLPIAPSVGESANNNNNNKIDKGTHWPPQVPTHPSATQRPVWPPPFITHPADHTPATHPPPSTTASPISTTSKRPPFVHPWPPTSRPPASWPPTSRPPASWPPTQYPTHPTTTTPTITTQSSDHHFQANCGAKNGVLDQERIVGGQNASPNEWPWIAVLFNNNKQFCGGSLITKSHILTAAHCVAHMSSWDVSRLKVHLGDYNINSYHEIKHVERRIKRVIRHRGFDSRTLYNDVAILALDKPVEFSSVIGPICLPNANIKSYNGKVGTVAGWGSLRENGPQPSILQKVSVPIWTNEQCKYKYGGAAPGGIIPSMMCAGQISQDSCSGDSGGPLMVNEGRWVQVGIVSWGIGCGKGQYPGVYTRITSFLPWIMKNL